MIIRTTLIDYVWARCLQWWFNCLKKIQQSRYYCDFHFLREVRQCAWDHTAREWGGQPMVLTPEPTLLSLPLLPSNFLFPLKEEMTFPAGRALQAATLEHPQACGVWVLITFSVSLEPSGVCPQGCGWGDPKGGKGIWGMHFSFGTQWRG